jgi:hypothetical protein
MLLANDDNGKGETAREKAKSQQSPNHLPLGEQRLLELPGLLSKNLPV